MIELVFVNNEIGGDIAGRFFRDLDMNNHIWNFVFKARGCCLTNNSKTVNIAPPADFAPFEQFPMTPRTNDARLRTQQFALHTLLKHQHAVSGTFPIWSVSIGRDGHRFSI